MANEVGDWKPRYETEVLLEVAVVPRDGDHWIVLRSLTAPIDATLAQRIARGAQREFARCGHPVAPEVVEDPS